MEPSTNDDSKKSSDEQKENEKSSGKKLSDEALRYFTYATQINPSFNHFQTYEADSPKDDPAELIKDTNQYFLVKTLSPEITKNEEKKRLHKDSLISMVRMFLIAQFLVLGVLTIGTIVMIFVFHGLNNDLDMEYVDAIVGFINIYIVSVVVEIIAMLKFIVENVFDTSIATLVELYKDQKQETNEKTGE